MDEFFAKKDAKKKKKKVYKASSALGTAVGAPAVAVKKEAEPAPETVAPKPRKPPTALKEYHDESWNVAFEEEKAPDFSGLKIATMIKPPTPPPEPEPESESSDSEEEGGDEKTVTDWATGEDRQMEQASAMDASMPNVSGGKYVPPGSRGGGGGGGGGGPRGRGARQQAAPDLTTMSFPSLSDAAADIVKPGDRTMDGFTTVEHGSTARGSHRGGGGDGGNVQGSRYIPPSQRNQFSALGRG